MAPQADIERPSDDPFSLMGSNWPSESEGAYHAAELNADALSTATTTQAESADDAERKMASESGKTAEAVAGGYGAVAEQLRGQSRDYTTISSWMLDAGGKVGKAKSQIADLVSTGTQAIREALNSELAGTPVTPSSPTLTDKYRGDIASVASKLSTDLDAIGHALHGESGSSRTPTYASVPTTPSIEHADPRAVVTAYNSGQHPAVEPQRLPEMPRATSTPSSAESPSTPGTPATSVAPHSVNPTLSNLISGGQSASPSGTPSAKSPSTPASAPAGQAHQSNEQHQQIRPTGIPRIPSIGLPNIPTAAAESITTAVTSSVGHQLPTAPSTPGSAQAPASTGFTPGISGAPPVTPAPPAGLAPIGSLPTVPPVTQAAPVVQASPAPSSSAAPAPAPQQSPSPAPRGPVADLGWIQKSYGLAPGLELPKSETTAIPALFIADLPEAKTHLHRALATIRHAFEAAGWGQPLAVGLIKRGLETRLVYVTADAISIHPHGVLLPQGVTPLDEMPSTPTTSELLGSLMVTDKLTRLVPCTWEIEQVLSTVPAEENSQSTEQYQQLVEAEELLSCTVSRGRDDVDAEEAMRVFARASIGSRLGCGELDVESARIRAARWIGTQPADYLEVLARWHLSDAAESMSRGLWGEAVWASEKYMSLNQSRSEAA
ncbi:hypothetical protein D2E95_09275 [Mycobacteroides abscessus]|nr:hypothetical protein D2E95_09275 [Mycobacteroides abscessus]RIU52518.1 hypothetical protein D2F02_05755 [Mycobacteroides abscessus]